MLLSGDEGDKSSQLVEPPPSCVNSLPHPHIRRVVLINAGLCPVGGCPRTVLIVWSNGHKPLLVITGIERRKPSTKLGVLATTACRPVERPLVYSSHSFAVAMMATGQSMPKQQAIFGRHYPDAALVFTQSIRKRSVRCAQLHFGFPLQE